MISYAKRLANSHFVRNVIIVATGTAGAQAVTMAFSPIITRLYGPEALGILGIFTAILTVLTPLAALSYPIAIVLPKRDADAIGLARLAIGVAAVISLMTALLFILFKTSIVDVLNLQAIEPFIFFLPLAMFFSVAMEVMSHWLIRKRLFKVKAKVAVLQALWLNSAKAGVGLFFPFSTILIILATLGSALHAAMLRIGVKKSLQGEVIQKNQSTNWIHESRFLAWSHRDFAYYRTPQIVLNAASQSMPVLMLTSFFGPSAAGFYTLARMVLNVPSRLIGQSLSDVFYPKFVETRQAGNSGKSLIINSFLSLLAVGSLPYIIIISLGPFLFHFVFGYEWEISGEFARWMTIWLITVLASRPVISAIPALGLQRQFLLFEIAAFLLRAIALAIGYVVFSSATSSIAVFSLANAVLYLALTAYVIAKS